MSSMSLDVQPASTPPTPVRRLPEAGGRGRTAGASAPGPSAGALRCAAAVVVEPQVGAAVSESTLPPQWLTAEQLAIYLSVSSETLKYWRAHARGPRYHKIGRRVRYAKADVDSWVATCAVG